MVIKTPDLFPETNADSLQITVDNLVKEVAALHQIKAEGSVVRFKNEGLIFEDQSAFEKMVLDTITEKAATIKDIIDGATISYIETILGSAEHYVRREEPTKSQTITVDDVTKIIKESLKEFQNGRQKQTN